MDFKKQFFPESKFGGFSNVDGTIVFYNRVNALLDPSDIVVDIGCGRGAYGEDPIPFRRALRILKGKCEKVIGIDLDPNASQNPHIDVFRLITGEHWPVERESANLCLADNVLEHVNEPEHFFSECRRILKPGGYLCIRTPNVLSYFGLFSKLVPNRGHVRTLQKVKEQVVEQDVFPTRYRCNTIGALRRILEKYGFEHYVYGYEAEPAYLSFSRLFYAAGVLFARFTPNLFRVGIHAFGVKVNGVQTSADQR
jgi:SAM-dependent methyltransferase